MATKPITKRQRYWLDHLNNAASAGGSLVAYANANDLKPKDLYVWKTQLIKLGHLPTPSKPAPRKFVPVVAVSNAASATLVMPNGFRIIAFRSVFTGVFVFQKTHRRSNPIMDKSAIPADYETLRELYTTQQAQNKTPARTGSLTQRFTTVARSAFATGAETVGPGQGTKLFAQAMADVNRLHRAW